MMILAFWFCVWERCFLRHCERWHGRSPSALAFCQFFCIYNRQQSIKATFTCCILVPLSCSKFSRRRMECQRSSTLITGCVWGAVQTALWVRGLRTDYLLIRFNCLQPGLREGVSLSGEHQLLETCGFGDSPSHLEEHKPKHHKTIDFELNFLFCVIQQFNPLILVEVRFLKTR